MRKAVWYLVHDLTNMSQTRFKSRACLEKYLRELGCGINNNNLSQITMCVMSKSDLDDVRVGELYLLTDDNHVLCVEELL